MPAPSKNWSNIQDAQIDADSPLDATLLTQIRDNLVHLKEWLGASFSAAQDHDHDGVNSKSPVLADSSVTSAKLADSAVTSTKLKWGQGSFSSGAIGTYYIELTPSTYVHLPTLEVNQSSNTNDVKLTIENPTNATYTGGSRYSRCKLVITSPDAKTWTVRWDYHTN